jgi:hypothetical protein
MSANQPKKEEGGGEEQDFVDILFKNRFVHFIASFFSVLIITMTITKMNENLRVWHVWVVLYIFVFNDLLVDIDLEKLAIKYPSLRRSRLAIEILHNSALVYTLSLFGYGMFYSHKFYGVFLDLQISKNLFGFFVFYYFLPLFTRLFTRSKNLNLFFIVVSRIFIVFAFTSIWQETNICCL